MTELERRLEHAKAKAMILVSLIVVGMMGASLHFNTFEGQLDWVDLKQTLNVADADDIQRKALICQHMREVECALGSYEQLLSIQPNNPQPLLEMARIYREDDNQQAALDHYMKYLESPNANIERLLEIADTLKAIGRMEEAITIYRNSIEDAEGLVNINASKALVRLYMSKGDKNKAWQAIQNFQRQTQSAKDHFGLEIRRLRGAGAVDTL